MTENHAHGGATAMSTDIPSTAAPSRGGCLAPALVVLVGFGVLAVALLASTCIRGGSRSTYETPLERLRPDDPLYLSTQGLYLVRLNSGEVLALDHNESRREDYVNGCRIRWRETLAAAGRTGLFRSDCTGTLYDLTGTPVQGDAPPMKRHPVTLEKDTVKVALNTCTAGAGGGPTPCKPA